MMNWVFRDPVVPNVAISLQPHESARELVSGYHRGLEGESGPIFMSHYELSKRRSDLCFGERRSHGIVRKRITNPNGRMCTMINRYKRYQMLVCRVLCRGHSYLLHHPPTQPTKVAGKLRRAVRSSRFAGILGGRHMECAYYFDFCRLCRCPNL